MSVPSIKINLPLLPYASSGQLIEGTCNAFIQYTPPQNVTIDHWRLTFMDVAFYPGVYQNTIKGKFRQLDGLGNLLSETDFTLTKGYSQTFPAVSGVAKAEVYIYYFKYEYATSLNLNVDQVLDGMGTQLIRIATEDSLNNETSACVLVAYKVIVTAKVREVIRVSGSPAVRTFNVTTTNTNAYIKEWWAEIKSVTGTPQSSDTLVLELLDANNNVLASNSVGIAVGNKIAVQHQSNGAKIRVTLNSSVSGLTVVVDVSEGIDIAYGT